MFKANEKHETYPEEKAIFEFKEFYFYYSLFRDTTNSVSKRICQIKLISLFLHLA